MTKVGILYISIGKYSIFWKDFYRIMLFLREINIAQFPKKQRIVF